MQQAERFSCFPIEIGLSCCFKNDVLVESDKRAQIRKSVCALQ